MQCYYNAQAGVKKLTTETGAGQWGTALSFACTLFGMEAEVWQVGSSYDQKPYRRLMMELYGSKVAPIACAAHRNKVICVPGPPLSVQRHRLRQGCARHQSAGELQATNTAQKSRQKNQRNNTCSQTQASAHALHVDCSLTASIAHRLSRHRHQRSCRSGSQGPSHKLRARQRTPRRAASHA